MPPRLIPLELTRESVTHKFARIELDIVDLDSFPETQESVTMMKGDINWNALNCEVGFRAKFPRGEISTWSSDFVHPNTVPHSFKNAVALHRFSEHGDIGSLERHVFIANVVDRIFENDDVQFIYAWMWNKSSQQIKQVLINLGWLPSSWYLYS